VCAGAKAIVDLSRTLEVLETLGVATLVYKSDEFPAFWSRHSGLRAPLRCDSVAEIAATYRSARELEIDNGMLIANPIAADAEIPSDVMTGIIERAIGEAQGAAISGKALTPWLLERIYQLTHGRSLEANIALVRANARLAAQIAKELL
jgi:pseudouridylate synthase